MRSAWTATETPSDGLCVSRDPIERFGVQPPSSLSRIRSGARDVSGVARYRISSGRHRVRAASVLTSRDDHSPGRTEPAFSRPRPCGQRNAGVRVLHRRVNAPRLVRNMDQSQSPRSSASRTLQRSHAPRSRDCCSSSRSQRTAILYVFPNVAAVVAARVIIVQGNRGDYMDVGTERLMLRPSEAAEAIGVSRSKAYELIAAGEIPSVTVGGCKRVPVDALRQWIDQRLAAAALNHRCGISPPGHRDAHGRIIRDGRARRAVPTPCLVAAIHMWRTASSNSRRAAGPWCTSGRNCASRGRRTSDGSQSLRWPTGGSNTNCDACGQPSWRPTPGGSYERGEHDDEIDWGDGEAPATVRPRLAGHGDYRLAKDADCEFWHTSAGDGYLTLDHRRPS